MSEVVAKLFALLGRVLMTCHGSLPIQPPSGLFCVRLKSYLTLIPFSDPVGFGLVLIGGRYSQRSPCRHLALKMCKFEVESDYEKEIFSMPSSSGCLSRPHSLPPPQI